MAKEALDFLYQKSEYPKCEKTWSQYFGHTSCPFSDGHEVLIEELKSDAKAQKKFQYNDLHLF